MAGLKGMNPHSRIWIYQSNRAFTDVEAQDILAALQEFALGWVAHASPLVAGADLRYRRFLILAVDESRTGASGCSIDTSLHFIQRLEEKYQVSLLDRMLFGSFQDSIVHVDSRKEFELKIESGQIVPTTLVFDNLIRTLSELEKSWLVPLELSWFSGFFSSSFQAVRAIK